MSPRSVQPDLTPRQREVLQLIARGYTNREIGDRLGISLDGAKWHVSEVLARLNLERREEAADYWRLQNGLRPRLVRLARDMGGAALGWKIAAGVGVVAVVGAAIGIVIAATGGDPDPTDGAVDEPTGVPTTPLFPSPRTPAPRALLVRPTTGACDAVLSFTATGFVPGSAIELVRFAGLDELVAEQTAVVSGAGEATFGGITLPDDCLPGLEYVFAARPSGADPGDTETRAVFAAEQIGEFWVEPAEAACPPASSLPITVRAEGLPAGLELAIFWGPADPFAHNFAMLGDATVSPDGALSFATALPCGAESTIGIYATDRTNSFFARWKTVLTVTPP